MRLSLDRVGHAYPGQPQLFQDITTDLTPGDVVALVGPSGSGKSTLLGIIAGWITPSAGTVTRSSPARVSWVFQNPHGVAHRTALDHVTLPLLGRGATRAVADADGLRVLDRFGLAGLAYRDYSALSGGEAQRLMLARAVAGRADIVLVDEPTAQLDPTSATTVIDVLHGLADSGGIVLIATHDPAVRARCTGVLDLAAHLPADRA